MKCEFIRIEHEATGDRSTLGSWALTARQHGHSAVVDFINSCVWVEVSDGLGGSEITQCHTFTEVRDVIRH